MRRCAEQALVLLATSAGLGLLGNAISPRGLPLRTPAPSSQELISLQEASELWRDGTAIFFDAREPEDYNSGHIGNAFNLPALHFEEHFEEVAPLLTPTSQIVIYCDGEDCELSHRVSERLKQMQFTNVRILSNGWTLWRQARLPVQEPNQTGLIE